LNIPPPWPEKPAAVPALLPENVQLVTVGEEVARLYIPPPSSRVELPENVQLVTVGEEEDQFDIPPPACGQEMYAIPCMSKVQSWDIRYYFVKWLA
jgi:hypothetical protein